LIFKKLKNFKNKGLYYLILTLNVCLLVLEQKPPTVVCGLTAAWISLTEAFAIDLAAQ
jgi:hypothetical protein